SQVGGTLSLDSLPALKITMEGNPLSFARCQLDVSAAGKVKLLLNSTAGVSTWLNGEPIEASDALTLDLPVGVHTLTIGIDRAKRQDSLRCTLDDVAGSPARVRIVGGK